MASRFSQGVEDELDGAFGGESLFEEAEIDSVPQHKQAALGLLKPKEEDKDAAYVETTIKDWVLLAKDQSESQMRDRITKWSRFKDMYRALYVPEGEDSPYKKFNVPRLARICDLFCANIMSRTVWDKHKLDFFRFMPEVSDWNMPIAPEASKYARLAEASVRNDMIKSRWIDDYSANLLDFAITGNMYRIMVYEQTTKHRFRKTPNPAYNPMLPPEANMQIGPDGSFSPIPPMIETVERVREYDAPKARYLSPWNVFPTELDRNNATECTGISIYDTTNMSELREGEIDGQGGGIYANLDRVSMKGAPDNVPEVGGRNQADTTTNLSSSVIKKLERISYFGALDPDQIFPDERVSPQAWTEFCLKFNIDMEKAKNWKTWLVEIVDGKTMVRCQPLPYMRDEIPIVHHRLFACSNVTLGEGLYDRCEYDERIYNFFNRMEIELTARQVRPPIGIKQSAIESTWYQMNGGTQLSIKPDMVVPINGEHARSINDAISPLVWPTAPMDALQKAKLDRERTMDMETHMPAVKQGLDSGGNTATEVGAMSNNADAILKELGEAIETGFLMPQLSWFLQLHHQYTEAPRSVSMFDDAGELAQLMVPPEAWLGEYQVNVCGSYNYTNKAVQSMNFKEFFTAASQSLGLPEMGGTFNAQEAVREWGRILEIREPDRFIIPKDQIMAAAQAMVQQQMEQMGMGGGMGGPQGPQGPQQMAEANRSHHAPGEMEKRQRGLHDEQGVQRSVAQQNRNPANARRASAI